MGGAKRIAIWGGLIGLALVSFFGFRTANRAGEFTTLQPLFEGACTVVEGFVGAEDIVADRASGQAFVIGHDRRAAKQGEATRGTVGLVSFPGGEAIATDLLGAAPAAFAPAGGDLHVDSEGVRRVFVANRAGPQHTIEIFRLEDERLVLERTLSDPLLRNPNDVVALDPDRAYVTLDRAAEKGSFGALLESGFARRSGKLLLIGPGGAAVVAQGFVHANGVALSADGSRVYVAETVGRALAAFERDPATNGLTALGKVFLGTGVDNLTRDEEGRIWAAAHPKLLTFAFGHARDASKTAPAQVIVLEPDATPPRGDQAYLTRGEQLSAASVAVADVGARRMLLGAGYERHILACDLPDVWRHSEARPARRPVARPGVGD